MRLASEVIGWLRSVLFGRREDRELDEEIRFHVESEAGRLRQSGMGAVEARRVAHIRFGGVERMRERTREARGGLWLERALKDLRIAHRSLLKTPGRTLAAVVTLGLGIGVATTMFGTIYGAFYRALPFPDVERFVYVRSTDARSEEERTVAYNDFLEWGEESRSFRDLAAAYTGTAAFRDVGDGTPLATAYVTWNALDVVGARPDLGRGFLAEDDVPGAPVVAVLSHRAWEERFGGRASVVGRDVVINGEPATIVGVMPDGFNFPETQDLWLPMRLDAASVERGTGPSVIVFGHLAASTTLEAANAEMSALAERTASAHPETNDGVGASVRTFRDIVLNNEGLLINWMLMLAALAVLAIACVNVANLLLARAAVRMREIALRSALGAARAQIMFQMLAESLALAFYGGLLGAAIGWAGVHAIAYGMRNTDTPYWIQFKLDLTVLAFTVAAAAASGVVAGLLPAIRATMGDFMAFLKDGSRGSTGLRIGRMSRALLGLEVAFSVCLLFVSGLMTKSVLNLARFDHPFVEEGVSVATIDLFAQSDPERRDELVDEALERIREVPGVSAAALASAIPGGFTPSSPVEVEGRAYATRQDVPFGHAMSVSPGFFALLGVTPVEGRAFAEADGEDALPVALVNETFARTRFEDGDAVGRRIRMNGLDPEAPWRTVVGVVPDLLMQGLANVGYGGPDGDAGVYVPTRQSAASSRTLLVRSTAAGMNATSEVREAVRSVDRDLALFGVGSLSDAIGQTTWYFTLTSAVFVGFGAVALFLAAVGLLGVVAFEAERRTQEVGVRMALGARTGHVMRLVLGQGMGPMLLGILSGVAMATGLARAMTIVLFQTAPNDPWMYAATVGVILLVGVLASLWPAVRASRTDPVKSLQAG